MQVASTPPDQINPRAGPLRWTGQRGGHRPHAGEGCLHARTMCPSER